MKQPQSSPLSLADQVSSIYAGTNGYLDRIPVDGVRDFLVGLRNALTTTKYGEIVSSTNALTEEAQTILKTTIEEYVEEFLAASK